MRWSNSYSGTGWACASSSPRAALGISESGGARALIRRGDDATPPREQGSPSCKANVRNMSGTGHPKLVKFNDRNGSRRDRRTFGFIAGKRSVKFRFPEADIHHRVLTTQSCHSGFPIAASQPKPGFPNRSATKQPLVTSLSGMLASISSSHYRCRLRHPKTSYLKPRSHCRPYRSKALRANPECCQNRKMLGHWSALLCSHP